MGSAENNTEGLFRETTFIMPNEMDNFASFGYRKEILSRNTTIPVTM